MLTATSVEIRDVRLSDWPEVAAIYQAGIDTGDATFETDVPSWETWDAAHLAVRRLVVVAGEAIVAWAALSPVSDRCVYGGVAENSIYVAPEAQGRGVGRALLSRLVEDAERAEIWTIQTGIFPENEASIALHLRCGFRIVGTRERLGRHHGVWRDVLLLERRSKEAGL